MENMSLGKQSRMLSKVTTDAVHRRFTKDNMQATDSIPKGNDASGDEFFFCKNCNMKISAFSDKEELKSHFENVKHERYSKCVYCRKPVYEYRYEKKHEVYHICQYD